MTVEMLFIYILFPMAAAFFYMKITGLERRVKALKNRIDLYEAILRHRFKSELDYILEDLIQREVAKENEGGV